MPPSGLDLLAQIYHRPTYACAVLFRLVGRIRVRRGTSGHHSCHGSLPRGARGALDAVLERSPLAARCGRVGRVGSHPAWKHRQWGSSQEKRKKKSGTAFTDRVLLLEEGGKILSTCAPFFGYRRQAGHSHKTSPGRTSRIAPAPYIPGSLLDQSLLVGKGQSSSRLMHEQSCH